MLYNFLGKKEERKENIMTNLFNGMFGNINPGMCRLSMDGRIAVKTSGGYKTYNVKENRLVNCDQFVFNIGEEMFFVIPTNKVAVGDIILVNRKPNCVIEVEDSTIKVLSYEDSAIKEIVPERHMFMGNTYFYGKIVSMFGNVLGGKGGMENMMKYMMLSKMMNNSGNSDTGMNAMIPFMLIGGNSNMFDNMFDGMFDSTNNETEEN